VMFVSGAPESMLQAVAQAGVVAMTLDCLSDLAGVDSVAIDCQAEGNTTVEYLAALGHVHIAFLAPRYPTAPGHWTQGIDPDALRLGQAMLEAKQRLRLDTSPILHHYYLQDTTQSDTPVRIGVDRLWRIEPPPTALVCFDPFTAAHAAEALGHRGLRCPADVSILARDCLQPHPTNLTLQASDPHQMGLAAADHLAERLSNPRGMARKLQFRTVLVEGPSTGPRPPC
jgi:DNA-binding LacI/PurR family transcriptional regulator